MAEASRGAEGVPGAVVATQAAGAMPDGMLAVEMAAHEDAQAGTGAAARLLGDLERHAGGGDDIVPPDHAFFLDAEDLVEIGAAEGHEGRDGIGRRPGELGVEAGEEALAQIAIGHGDGGDAGESQLVHEAALQGAIGALAAPARLGRIAQDVLDAKAGEGAADLSGMPTIDRAARGRCMRGPVGAIGIERHGQAVTLKHGVQGRHDGGDAFAAGAQFGIEDLLGGVIDADDHGEPPRGHQGEPLMPTAIEVQQLPEARAGLAAAAMAAAGLMFGDQARGLERLFHEGVAEAHAVLPAGELMKVADVEALIAIPVKGEQVLDLRERGPLGRRRLASTIEQAVIAEVLELPAQASDAAGASSEDVGRLQPSELAVDSAKDDLLDLHGALHGAERIGHGHLLGGHSSHAAR